jgi:hypothetical protein
MDQRVSLRGPAAVALLLWLSAATLGAGVAQRINQRGPLAPGDSVSTLRGYGLDNQPVVVDYRQQPHPTVVYVIDEHGNGFVRQNEPNFVALVTQARGRFTFVVLCPVDTGGLREYLAGVRPTWKDAPVTVVANVSEELRQEMSLFMYPQTVVISTDGKVLQNFLGAYTNASRNAHPGTIEAFFGIKLPPGGRP